MNTEDSDTVNSGPKDADTNVEIPNRCVINVEVSHIFDMRHKTFGYCKSTIDALHVYRFIYHVSRETNQYKIWAGHDGVPVSV